MTTWRANVLCAVLAGLGAAPAAGADEGPRIDQVRVGPSVLGPKVRPDDLKDRVVLIKFWGVN
jgi:hypothetical protein